jgi:hypothetical protein
VVLPFLFLGWNLYLNGMGNGVALKMTHSIVCWTTERGGGVNQLLLCLNNYAHFKLFTEHSMTITIMQGSKQ